MSVFAMQNCYRAMSYAASQGNREPGERKYVKSHPDYVSIAKLKTSIEHLGKDNSVVAALLSQLNKTPEYLEAGSSKKTTESISLIDSPALTIKR